MLPPVKDITCGEYKRSLTRIHCNPNSAAAQLESSGKRDKYDKVICNAKIEAIQSWIDTSGAREEMPLSYLISDSDALSVSLFCFLVSLVSTALSCSLCSSLCPLSCNIREGVVPPNTDKS
jgi:hypothetical protein